MFYFDPIYLVFVGPAMLLVAFAVAIVVVIVRNANEKVTRAVGVAALAVTELYVVQLQRLVSAAGGAGGADPSLTDFLGFGVLPAAAGGVLAAFASKLGAPKR